MQDNCLFYMVYKISECSEKLSDCANVLKKPIR